MSKMVTIYGGSGFVGRYIARRMANEGWRVRVAVRRPNEAMFVKTYGVVGQVRRLLAEFWMSLYWPEGRNFHRYSGSTDASVVGSMPKSLKDIAPSETTLS